jgi:hypothetical protein
MDREDAATCPRAGLKHVVEDGNLRSPVWAEFWRTIESNLAHIVCPRKQLVKKR